MCHERPRSHMDIQLAMGTLGNSNIFFDALHSVRLNVAKIFQVVKKNTRKNNGVILSYPFVKTSHFIVYGLALAFPISSLSTVQQVSYIT